MTPDLLRRPRGFTLIELLVAVTVSAIVLAAVFGVVQGQQTAYYQGNLQRAAQSSARSALAFIEQRLALAGYGMDAPLAFDFTRYGIDAAYPAPCPALAGGCPRDRVDGNDELVFYERNSRYWLPDQHTDDPRGNAWRVLSLAGNTIRVNARPGDLFAKGQVVQVVCNTASRYAYMTVAQNAGPVAGDPNATEPPPPPEVATDIALMPPVATDPFRRQDSATDACFSDVGAPPRMFLIDRYRFHVRPVQVGNGAQPYLVLDMGLDANGDGPDEAEEVVVAEGIESFQVGYVMTNGLLGAPRGTIPGTTIAFTPGDTGATTGDAMTTLQYPGPVAPGTSEYQATSWYGYTWGPPPATQRMTDHQANIRGVRIVIVGRGPDLDPAGQRLQQLLPILNENVLPAWVPANAPYNRARLETTVLVRNMAARAMNDF